MEQTNIIVAGECAAPTDVAEALDRFPPVPQPRADIRWLSVEEIAARKVARKPELSKERKRFLAEQRRQTREIKQRLAMVISGESTWEDQGGNAAPGTGRFRYTPPEGGIQTEGRKLRKVSKAAAPAARTEYYAGAFRVMVGGVPCRFSRDPRRLKNYRPTDTLSGDAQTSYLRADPDFDAAREKVEAPWRAAEAAKAAAAAGKAATDAAERATVSRAAADANGTEACERAAQSQEAYRDQLAAEAVTAAELAQRAARHAAAVKAKHAAPPPAEIAPTMVEKPRIRVRLVAVPVDAPSALAVPLDATEEITAALALIAADALDAEAPVPAEEVPNAAPAGAMEALAARMEAMEAVIASLAPAAMMGEADPAPLPADPRARAFARPADRERERRMRAARRYLAWREQRAELRAKVAETAAQRHAWKLRHDEMKTRALEVSEARDAVVADCERIEAEAKFLRDGRDAAIDRAERLEFDRIDLEQQRDAALARVDSAERITAPQLDAMHGRLVQLERAVGMWESRAKAAGWRPTFNLGGLMRGGVSAGAA